MAEYGRIRALANHIGVESVERERHLLILRFKDDAPVDLARLVSFVEGRPNVTLIPPGVIRVDLEADHRAMASVPQQRLTDQSTSWWTKRATADQVEKGFTKKQLIRSDGIEEGDKLLENVHALLTELSHGD